MSVFNGDHLQQAIGPNQKKIKHARRRVVRVGELGPHAKPEDDPVVIAKYYLKAG